MTYWRQPLDRDRVQITHGIVHIIEERCKGCGFCVEFCPQKALRNSAEINSHGYHYVSLADSDKCSGCNICGMICPEFAITVIPVKETGSKRK